MKYTSIIAIFFAVFLFVTGCSLEAYNDNSIQQTAIENEQQLSPLQISPKEYSDAEEYILKLFKGPETSRENRQKVINALEDIHWSEYDRLSQGKTMDLLSWLDNIEITESKEITSILKATNGLDGAYTEMYADIITMRYSLRIRLGLLNA